MAKRILFIIVYIIWLPVIFVSAPFTAAVMFPLAGILWVIKGGDSTDIIELALSPFIWTISFPFKITGTG